jgi:hypothetical protein
MATRRPRAKPDEVFYVLSQRTKLFTWNPVKLYPTYDLAAYYKELFEGVSIYGGGGYKITKVTLVKDLPDAGEIITLS